MFFFAPAQCLAPRKKKKEKGRASSLNVGCPGSNGDDKKKERSPGKLREGGSKKKGEMDGDPRDGSLFERHACPGRSRMARRKRGKSTGEKKKEGEEKIAGIVSFFRFYDFI